MKKLLAIVPSFVSLLWLSSTTFAAPTLDELLVAIKEDIAANRLSSPANNNALERIKQYREQAPFDFRVVPLVYQWGEAYVALAHRAMDNRNYQNADEYLDKVYHVAALTPGLEEAQERLDRLYDPSQVKSNEPEPPTEEDIERLKKLEAIAAAEKAKVEAENRRKAEEERRLAVEARRKAEAERKQRQEMERIRRLELEQAEKEQKAAAAQKANTVPEKSTPVVTEKTTAPTRTLPPMFNKTAPAAADATIVVVKDSSEALAEYDISTMKVRERDLSIAQDLVPICQDIIDKEASIVIHAPDKSDYRWLIVRMTLCVRDIDSSFRLRYSQQSNPKAGKMSISLHPARDSSLIRVLPK